MITNKDLKRRILEISFNKKLSHIGSCLTACDIIAGIYNKKKPEEPFVLSSGHAGLALYCVLEKHGGRNAEEIFDHHGVHPDRCDRCGLSVSAGSLGHGLGIAVGMALSDRTRNVYCLISDGECSEGSIAEALRIRDEQKLDNLKVYINYNTFGAYKKIDNLYLSGQALNHVNVIRTGKKVAHFPFLKDIDAHYKVMNWQEYQEALKILQ